MHSQTESENLFLAECPGVAEYSFFPGLLLQDPGALLSWFFITMGISTRTVSRPLLCQNFPFQTEIFISSAESTPVLGRKVGWFSKWLLNVQWKMWQNHCRAIVE